MTSLVVLAGVLVMVALFVRRLRRRSRSVDVSLAMPSVRYRISSIKNERL